MSVASGREHDVIIVGGGHNGLVCAYYIAQAGLDVLVLERRPVVGGQCVTENLLGGGSFSTCANQLWGFQPKIAADMRLEDHGFEYFQTDPLSLHLYGDGSHLFQWRDLGRTRESVGLLHADDARRLAGWDDYWARVSRIMAPFVLREAPSKAELLEFAGSIGERELCEELFDSSVEALSRRFFEDVRIQAAFVQAYDFGDPATPGSAWPASSSVLGRLSRIGDAFVAGGSGGLTSAMARAVSDAGADIELDAEVAEILVSGGRATGVRLATGDELQASVVVSNADPKTTFLRLVGPDHLTREFLDGVEDVSTRAGCLKLHGLATELPDVSAYLGRPAEPREVGCIRIVESLDHLRTASAQAFGGVVPDRFVIGGLMIPSVYDSSLVADGRHTVSIWVPYVPVRPSDGSWDDIRDDVGARLVDYISGYIPNFASSLERFVLLTPADIERRMAATDGSIHHVDTIGRHFGATRSFGDSTYGTPIDGLYLCGAGTHPSPEVTGAPGHNAAQSILRARTGAHAATS